MDFSIEQCFQILAVPMDASLEEVKGSYRDLAAVWHPDRFSGNPRLEKKATEKLQEINAAYETLLMFYDEKGRFETGAESLESPFTDPDPSAPCRRQAGPRFKFLAIAAIAGALIAVALTVWVIPGFKDRWNASRATPPKTLTALPKVYEPAPKEPTVGKIPTGQRPSVRIGRTAPGAPPPSQKGSFTLGATKDEVWAAEGPATQVSEARWAYGSSYVDFTGGKVTGWHSSSLDPLHVRMDASKEMAVQGYFGVGSSKGEVVAAQGTPDKVSGESWGYGFSSVVFEKGRVTGWYSSSVEPLRVRMTPSTAPDKRWFTVGSSKDEVLAAEGTPTQLADHRWSYGFSYVDFEKGKVTRWYSSEQRPLHTEPEP